MDDYQLVGYNQEEDEYDPTGILAEADRIYNMGGPQYYPGQTVAGINPYIDEGIQSSIDAANQAASYTPGMMDAAQGGLAGMTAFAQGGGQQVGGQYTDMMGAGDFQNIQGSFDVNPYLDSMADATGAAIGRNWQQNVIPGLTSNALGAGQMGSSRHGIAQGLAGAQQGAQLNETLAGLYGTGWESAMQNQTTQRGQTLDALGNERLRGTTAAIANSKTANDAWGNVSGGINALANMGQTTASIGQMPGAAMLQGGQIYQQTAQDQIDAEVARWNHYQNLPNDNLTRYSNLVNGTAKLSGNTSGATPSYTNPWDSAAGGWADGGAWGNQLKGWFTGQ